MASEKKRIEINIKGMHCPSCEVLIERKWRKIEGVERVRVNHASGRAVLITTAHVPSKEELQEAITTEGYEVVSVSHASGQNADATLHHSHKNTIKDYIEIGAVALILFAIYTLLSRYDILPSNFGVTENMSYGFTFLIGIVAAISTCLAVTGGLLLAIATKYDERYPNLSGIQKFRPHIYFNIGRILSYTILGAAVGALGSVLSFSPKANGILTIIASVVMILLGLQLLKLFPGLRRLTPKMPKFIAHKIYDASDSENYGAPMLFGAATFFFPCGFTQALQIYVLSTGDPLTGALTMLAFSLGTLPALVSLGAITSFTKGHAHHYFLRFAGVLVILLGMLSIKSGMVLAGIGNIGAGSAAPTTDQNIRIEDGKQIVDMKVVGYEYLPSKFTIYENMPVEWRIDGSKAAGCAQIVIAPSLGITAYLSKTEIKTVTFTPQKQGKIMFSCTMGMTTPGAHFNVIARPATS